jgi:hypothetical protein
MGLRHQAVLVDITRHDLKRLVDARDVEVPQQVADIVDVAELPGGSLVC